MYCQYWREKLKSKPKIKFPKKLCPAIAGITQEFSFAYLKEAFVATLLTIARHRSDFVSRGGGDDEDDGDLDAYELWREMKKMVKVLREDMGTRNKRSAFDDVLEASVPQPHPSISKLPSPDSWEVPAVVPHDLSIRSKREPPISTHFEHPGTADPPQQPWSTCPLIADDGQLLEKDGAYDI